MFIFKPPVTRLDVRASPPSVTLLDTAEVLVPLENSKGEPVARMSRAGGSAGLLVIVL
jgi:hypothetical protein